MKPSFVFSLLLFFFILHEAQGIRLEKGFVRVENQNVNEEKNRLTETRNDEVNGEVIFCQKGHCTGWNRKLATATTTISTDTSKTEKNRESKASPMAKRGLANGEMGGQREKVTINSSSTSGQHEVNHGHYVDIMGIAEMDYTPARRKTPIHN